jgi:prepilin-type N-terminal cleavage/methylation domain-containing protein
MYTYNKQKRSQRGYTLIELLVALFVFSIAFVALYGLLVSSITLLGQNKAKLGAVSLVEEQIEYVRSLPYSGVGVVLGNPSGPIPATATTTLNGTLYTLRTAVFWVDDPKDGVASTTVSTTTDMVSTDYKQVKVEASWDFRGQTKSFSAVTTIAPKGLETNVPGGIFKITVFDASGAPVPGAIIDIVKSGILNVTRIVPDSGIWHEYGVATGTDYEITVTKPGYTTAKTYSVTPQLADPFPPHHTSIDDQVNPIAFEIDRVSSANVYVYDVPASGSWSDTFPDDTKLAATTFMERQSGDVTLVNTAGVYASSGSAFSTWITPTDISEWTEFSWSDTRPASTTLVYHVYYDNGGVETLVPDSDLPGNAAGIISTSSISLVGLNGLSGVTSYEKIKVGVTATTDDTMIAPAVHNWTVTYVTHTPRASFSFNMHGLKDMGDDSGGLPVYKYDTDVMTDTSGVMATSSLEWDTYTIQKTGYDVMVCDDSSLYIAPDTMANIHVDMTPSAPHAILVRVEDSGGSRIPYARVRLYRPSFDQTKITSGMCAHVFWSGRPEGTVAGGDAYSIDVSIPPYTSTTTVTDVDVSDYSEITVTVP